jgi:hypothetical protein
MRVREGVKLAKGSHERGSMLNVACGKLYKFREMGTSKTDGEGNIAIFECEKQKLAAPTL